MVRKQAWQALMSDHDEISDYFKDTITENYMSSIKNRVLREKDRFVEKLKKRADQKNFLMVVPRPEDEGESVN